MQAFLPILLAVLISALALIFLGAKISNNENNPFIKALKILLLFAGLSLLFLNTSLPIHFINIENSSLTTENCARIYVGNNFTETCTLSTTYSNNSISGLESATARNMEITMWALIFIVFVFFLWLFYSSMKMMRNAIRNRRTDKEDSSMGLGDDEW